MRADVGVSTMFLKPVDSTHNCQRYVVVRGLSSKAFSFNEANFARGQNSLGDTMFWATIQSDIVQLSPTQDMGNPICGEAAAFCVLLLRTCIQFTVNGVSGD